MTSNRFNQHLSPITNELNYNKTLTNKLRKLSRTTNEHSQILPRIYAKANELNRKLNSSQSLNHSDHESLNNYIPQTGEINLENLSNKDVYIKAYNRTRKKSMIVSKYLDEDMKIRLEQLKYANSYSSRRPSLISCSDSFKTGKDVDFEEDTESFNINDNDLFNKLSKLTSSESQFNLNNLKSRNPRFGSTLSKDGQLALMKSLEDTIVSEIETSYPELKNRIPRTTTAQFSKRKLSNVSVDSYTNSDATNSMSLPRNGLSGSNVHSNENFQYEQSEFFNSDLNHNNSSDRRVTLSQLTNDLDKQLIVTKQIDSALEILDKLRENQHKSSKKIQFNNKIKCVGVDMKNSRSDRNLQRNNLLAPLKASKLGVAQIVQAPMDANKLDPLLKYSEWKNVWMEQLENI